METTVIAILLALGANGDVLTEPNQSNPEERLAVTCFITGEQISGLNKICYYDCVGSAYAITIRAAALCPLTIRR